MSAKKGISAPAGKVTAKPKTAVKKKRDWAALDAAHKKRGEMLAVYLLDASAGPADIPALPPTKNGRPQKYSDATIEALLTLKVLLRLTLRAIEGLAQGLNQVARSARAVPDFSTLSRREGSLNIDIGARLDPSKRHVLVVDATGLKVFGEGEWKVKVHGTNIHRTWRKVHILVDRETGNIIDVETTLNNVGDAKTLLPMLPEDLNGSFVLGDGAYHTKELHREVFRRGGTLLSPPPKNAKRWGRQTLVKQEAAFAFRNRQLTVIKRMGRTEWKIASGAGQRSFVESTNHRLKCIIGDRLAARKMDRQRVEVRLRCKVLNRLARSSGNMHFPEDLPAQKPLSVSELIYRNGIAA
jgi:hypothetical protein